MTTAYFFIYSDFNHYLSMKLRTFADRGLAFLLFWVNGPLLGYSIFTIKCTHLKLQSSMNCDKYIQLCKLGSAKIIQKAALCFFLVNSLLQRQPLFITFFSWNSFTSS